MLRELGVAAAGADGRRERSPRRPGDELSAFARSWTRIVRPSRWVQRTIEGVVHAPRVRGWLLPRIARVSAGTDRLVRVTGDLDAPARLLSPSLLAPMAGALLTPPLDSGSPT